MPGSAAGEVVRPAAAPLLARGLACSWLAFGSRAVCVYQRRLSVSGCSSRHHVRHRSPLLACGCFVAGLEGACASIEAADSALLRKPAIYRATVALCAR